MADRATDKPSDRIEPVISSPPTTTDSYGGGAPGRISGSPTEGPRASEMPDVNTYDEAGMRRGSFGTVILTVFGLILLIGLALWAFTAIGR